MVDELNGWWIDVVDELTCLTIDIDDNLQNDALITGWQNDGLQNDTLFTGWWNDD